MVVINKCGIKITLIDNGSTLNFCSVNLLDMIGVDKAKIELDFLSIHGFDNVGKQPLSVITLHVKVGKVTLQTLIHVMPGNLSYNLLLGRPWVHAMNAIPSTLHYLVKYVYNNKVYTIKVGPHPEICLHAEKNKESPLKILIPTSKVKLMQEEEKESNIEEVTRLLEEKQAESSKACESTTFSKEEENTSYTSTYEECDNEKPPNPKEMEKTLWKRLRVLEITWL